MTEYAVRTEMVQKVYGKQKALNQISIHIEQGSIYGLIGRNTLWYYQLRQFDYGSNDRRIER